MSKKVDNTDMGAKVLVREWLMGELGGVKKTNVLELFGGEGHIYDHVYTEVPKHLAFDIRKIDRPGWLQGDNRVLLKTRCSGWNLYDVDAYGSPWQVCGDIHRLREGGRYGLAITDGFRRVLNSGTLPQFIRQKTGYNGMPNNMLLGRWYHEIVQLLLEDWKRYGVKVEKAKKIVAQGNYRMAYYGMVVTKGA